MKTCIECGNEVKGKYRKLCWTCINCHSKRGMTREAWEAEKARRQEARNKGAKICVLCQVKSHYTLDYGVGLPMCDPCRISLKRMEDPAWMDRVKGLKGVSV